MNVTAIADEPGTGRHQVVLSLDNAGRRPYNGGQCRWNLSQRALYPEWAMEAVYSNWAPGSTVLLHLSGLVFGPAFETEVEADSLTVTGYAHRLELYSGKEVMAYRETVLYQANGSQARDGGLNGDGLLLSLGGFHSVLITLRLGFESGASKRDGLDRRDFRATYLWNEPVVLRSSIGQMTFPLPGSYLPEVDRYRTTVEFFPATADHLLLLNFTSLPANTTTTITTRNGSTTTTSVSNSIAVDGAPLEPFKTVFLQSPAKPGITISINLPRPIERSVTFRYWQVKKDCSKRMILKVGQPSQAILIPTNRKTNESSVALRCAVFYTTTEPGDKLLLSTPCPSSLANMADQLYLYDPQGQPVLGLNNLANAHFSALDTISETNSAVVLYESPYLSPPNVDFQVPQIKAIPTQGKRLVKIIKKILKKLLF